MPAGDKEATPDGHSKEKQQAFRDGKRAGLILAAKMIRARGLASVVGSMGPTAFDRRQEFARMLDEEANRV